LGRQGIEALSRPCKQRDMWAKMAPFFALRQISSKAWVPFETQVVPQSLQTIPSPNLCNPGTVTGSLPTGWVSPKMTSAAACIVQSLNP
jgi:hypothetical protein